MNSEVMETHGVKYLVYAFLTMFTIVLVVSFGLTLSHLGDAGVLSVGVVAIVASIIAVAVQGTMVQARSEAVAAMAISDPGFAQMDTDRFVVRSYALIARPDKMNMLRASFTSASIQQSMNDRAYIQCGGNIEIGQVSYESDAVFLVIAKGATSDAFRADVMNGRVSTIMLGGALLRVVSLTAIDFTDDTKGIALGIADGNDIYVVSARGSAGSVPADSSCKAVDIFMPWNGQANTTAVQALSPMNRLVGQTVPVQIWGIGGR